MLIWGILLFIAGLLMIGGLWFWARKGPKA